ncbi:hypothetical protein D3C87_1878210 [compost metagenome]
MLFDERDDLLARQRGDRANDVAAALIAQQRAGSFEIPVDVGMGIDKDGLEAPRMARLDLIDRQLGAVAAVAAHRPVGAGCRVEDTDLHRVTHEPAKNQKPHDAYPIGDGASWGETARRP